MIGQVIAAVTGTVGFSVLYSVPRAYYPYCGFIGGAGWFLYCLLLFLRKIILFCKKLLWHKY